MPSFPNNSKCKRTTSGTFWHALDATEQWNIERLGHARTTRPSNV